MAHPLSEELRNHALPQVVLLGSAVLAMLLAAIGRRRGWKSSKWLATVGIAAPTLALGLAMLDLAISYERMLMEYGFVESVQPAAPTDQQSTAVAQHRSPAREIVGGLVGLMMPIAAWVWARVHWPEKEQRGLRWLALAGGVVVTVATLSLFPWTFEFAYPPFRNFADCGSPSSKNIDASFASLEQVRARVIGAGALLGVLAAGYGAMQALRGRVMRLQGWAALFVFVSLAGLVKLWTSDERSDTRAAFAWPPNEQGGGGIFLQADADDPYKGPPLEHCRFEFTGLRWLDVTDEYPYRERMDQWWEWIDGCTDPGYPEIGPILAEPELVIGDIAPALESAHAHGYTRFAVASLRPVPTTRATLGEFFRLQSCIVEFAVADEGVPLERFATWGDLAKAVDAAEGTLVIALPDDPEALPRSPEPPPPRPADEQFWWSSYLAIPDQCWSEP